MLNLLDLLWGRHPGMRFAQIIDLLHLDWRDWDEDVCRRIDDIP